MTLAAMRVFLGLSKGREVSLLREARWPVGLLEPGGFDVLEDELGKVCFGRRPEVPACCDDGGSRQVS